MLLTSAPKPGLATFRVIRAPIPKWPTKKANAIQINELDLSEICNNPFLKDDGLQMVYRMVYRYELITAAKNRGLIKSI